MPDDETFEYDEVTLGPDSRYPGRWHKLPKFQDALEASWSEALANGSPNALLIASISIRGTNPVREYKIDFN